MTKRTYSKLKEEMGHSPFVDDNKWVDSLHEWLLERKVSAKYHKNVYLQVNLP